MATDDRQPANLFCPNSEAQGSSAGADQQAAEQVLEQVAEQIPEQVPEQVPARVPGQDPEEQVPEQVPELSQTAAPEPTAWHHPALRNFGARKRIQGLNTSST